MADEVEEPPVESLAPSASPSFGAPKPARANNGVHKVAPEPPPGGHHCRVTRPTTPGAWQDGTEHQVLKAVSFEADPGSTVVVSTTATNAAASRPYLVTGDLTTEESGTSPSTSPTRSRTMKMRRQQTLSFISRTTPRVKISVSADFKRHAAKISQQLRQRDRDRVWVVDPRDSCLLSTWDAITTCALIYTALITPFEVGFLSASTTVDAWFVMNRMLDAIFIVDMMLQFCVVYQQASERGDGDAKWVTERRKIVKNYVFGWFPLDLFSILPSIFDIVPLIEASSPDNAGDSSAELAEKLSGFRAVRALRLVKLIRLIRASRMLARWQARIGLSHSAVTSAKIIVMMSLSAHWYSCIFALQAVLHDDPAGTWLGLQGHCSDVPIASRLEPGQEMPRVSEIFDLQCENLSLPSFYLAAFSWSAMIITGLGGTDFYPSQDNTETIIVTILVVFGALMWAKVLASFCELATNSDPSLIEYRQAIDDLNRFCRDQGFAPELKRRLRQYFQQRKHVMLAKAAGGVIHKMSTSLQIEVVMLVHSHWLDCIWLLRGAEPACLVQLALRMEPCVFSPGEIPEGDHIYVIHRGIVAQGLRMLTSGKLWGEELVLPDGASKVQAQLICRCMTYVEVYSISRHVFFKVTSAFPVASRLVKRAVTILKMRFGLLRLVKDLRKQRSEGDNRGFMDMILMATDGSFKGTRATVNYQTGEGGTVPLQLIEDVTATKSTVEVLAKQVKRIDTGLATMAAGLNRLLEKSGLDPVDVGNASS